MASAARKIGKAPGTHRPLRWLLGPLALVLSLMMLAAPAQAAPSLVGNALDFGEIEVGAFSDSQAMTLTNSGTQTLWIEEIDLGGAASTDFEVTDSSCSGARLTYGESCVIELRAAPTELGVRRGTLIVESSSYSSPDSFSLKVVGRASGSHPGGGSSGTSGSGGGGSNNGGGTGDPSQPRRIGKPPRIHTRVGFLNLSWGGRVAVATITSPPTRARWGTCRLLGATAFLTSRTGRWRIPVRVPTRIRAGGWARVFVIVPRWQSRRLATARRFATVTVSLSAVGPDGARASAFMRRPLIP
jgi:hypothetical protein